MLNEIFKEITMHLIKEAGDRVDHWGETPKERESRKRTKKN